MDTIIINNQKQLNDLLESIDWHEAFIREFYSVSPSYVIEDPDVCTVAPDALPCLKIIISIPDTKTPGIEFFFEEVKSVNLSFSIDLELSGRIDSFGVKFCLNGKGCHSYIYSEKLSYRILNKQSWGWNIFYGTDYQFDESGFKIG